MAPKDAKQNKREWTRLRRRFNWYLRTPFSKAFDRRHWWATEETIEPEAALYEVIRRHPVVREIWIKSFRAHMRHKYRDLIHCWNPQVEKFWVAKMKQVPSQLKVSNILSRVCSTGTKSWAQLDLTERQNFEISVGKTKGIDNRAPEQKCRSIIDLAESRVFENRRATMVKPKMPFAESCRLTLESLQASPATEKEWDDAIASESIKVFKSGYQIFAVSSDLNPSEAASSMKEAYEFQYWQFQEPMMEKRARAEDWLKVIAEFEVAENTKSKAKSQLFKRYRQIFDGFQFEGVTAQV